METTETFEQFCLVRGHVPAELTESTRRALAKLYREKCHLESANRDAYGDHLPEE
jgi:hypothetical protein